MNYDADRDRDRPILPSDVSRKRVPRGCAALVVVRCEIPPPRVIARRNQRDQTVCAARERRCGNLRSRGVDTIRDLPYPGLCIHERRLRGAAARLLVRGVRATTRVRALNCVTSFSCDFLTTTCIFTLIASQGVKITFLLSALVDVSIKQNNSSRFFKRYLTEAQLQARVLGGVRG